MDQLESNSDMPDCRVHFILPSDARSEEEASDQMVEAYACCKQLAHNVSWLKEADLDRMTFNKQDYLVFDNFEGRNFDRLVAMKCFLVGPLAISVCLMEAKTIPRFPWPILNVVLLDCEVTCSQLSKAEKESISEKVKLMGGSYSANFTKTTTHLICDKTNSEKYHLAASQGAKIMLPSWIDYLYGISLTSNVNRNDEEALEKHKCPPFHKLTICSTGVVNMKTRKQLESAVAENGGAYVARLNLATTDILVCHGSSGTTSDKYRAARKSTNVACVTLDWIYDSIQKGYSLPCENYKVKTATSTPTKEGENVDPNFSTISTISETWKHSTIDETAYGSNRWSKPGTAQPKSNKVSNKRKADEDLVEKLDIKKVKSAGTFLDGCSILVAGFSAPIRDKLNKIINISGATRYDSFSSRVTHVIVGDTSSPEIVTVKSMGADCCFVSVQWLIDSVENRNPVNVDQYLVNFDSKEEPNSTITGSPLSRKVLSLLRESQSNEESTMDDTHKCEVVEVPEDPLTEKYLVNAAESNREEDTLARLLGSENPLSTRISDKSHINTKPLSKSGELQEGLSVEFKPDGTSTQIDAEAESVEIRPIFANLSLLLEGLDEDAAVCYKDAIIAAGGTVLKKRFKGTCDYAVYPVVWSPPENPSVQEVVNEMWLKQCLEDNTLYKEIDYYHRVIKPPEGSPLKGCVICISTYTSLERLFLKGVVESLGGVMQEHFARKPRAAQNTLASTHLVCPEPTGKKYEAALKWNIPAVTKDWLLDCLKSEKMEPLERYSTMPEPSRESSLVSNNSDRNSVGVKPKKPEPCRESPQPTKNPDITGELSKTPHITGALSKTPDITGAWSKTPNITGALSKTQGTPESTNQFDDMKTPQRQTYNFDEKNHTPEVCSQVTPINKIIQQVMKDKVLPTPPTPQPHYPWTVKTPDTPLGQFIRDNPSPGLRKEMQRYVDSFPEFVPPKRRQSTPLSELRRQLWHKAFGTHNPSQCSQNKDPLDDVFEGVPDSTEQPDSPKNLEIHQKLQELHKRVIASGSGSATRRSSAMFEAATSIPGVEKTSEVVQSQVCTVGWDYDEKETQHPKMFMLSAIPMEERDEIAEDLKKLGANLCDSSSYDPSVTHLICPKPGKNEKTLACMASGKWILHTSYVIKSMEAGRFLNEEEFEFGNPKSRQNVTYEEKDNCVCFWRKEIGKRGYGAFHDVRAIIVAERKDSIVNVIKAGGGAVVNVDPPYDDPVDATHCFLEIKMIKNFAQYVPLAKQGVKCLNTVYISRFLCRDKNEDLKNLDNNYIIPYFSKYYN